MLTTTYEPGDLVVCRPLHKRPFLGVVTRVDLDRCPYCGKEPCRSTARSTRGHDLANFNRSHPRQRTETVHVCTRYTLNGDPHPFAGQARAFYINRVSPASPAQLRRHNERIDP